MPSTFSWSSGDSGSNRYRFEKPTHVVGHTKCATPTTPWTGLFSGVGLATWTSLPLSTTVRLLGNRVSDKNRCFAGRLAGSGPDTAGAFPLVVNRGSI